MFNDYPMHRITEISFVAGLKNGQDVGDMTISSNLSLPSTQDGDMVTLYTRNLTINAGCTLTTSNRCKGLRIICLGDCDIAGTISMTAKGAYAVGVDVPITLDQIASFVVKMPASLEVIKNYMRNFFTVASEFSDMPDSIRPEITRIASDAINIGTVPAAGGAGGAVTTGYGGAGGTGTNRQCGGGGAGGSYNSTHLGGAGAAGTAFSGGAGGGGSGGATSSATAGSANGGQGGNGGAGAGGGGAGNPGGSGYNAGASGTGGLLILIVLGNLTLRSTASILSKGSNGGNAGTTNYSASGGGSGGGSINIAYKGNLVTYSGYNISASGGAGGTVGNRGGNGGDGCITIEKLAGG